MPSDTPPRPTPEDLIRDLGAGLERVGKFRRRGAFDPLAVVGEAACRRALHAEAEVARLAAEAARLAAEVERLTAHCDGYRDAFDTQHEQIERLTALLRRALLPRVHTLYDPLGAGGVAQHASDCPGCEWEREVREVLGE